MSDETFNCEPDEYLDQIPELILSTPPGIWSYVCLSLRVPYHPTVLSGLLFYISRTIFECCWKQEDPAYMTAADIAQYMKRMYAGMEIVDCMIGSIVPYATEETPGHMLPCEGGTFNRVDYPLLYEVLDSVYIIDADTFQTPDLRGRMPVGSGTGTGLTPRQIGEYGGEEEHTLTESEMPPHTHGYTQPTFGIDVESVGVPDPTGVGNPPVPMTTSSTGGGSAFNKMTPYHVVKYGIIAR